MWQDILTALCLVLVIEGLMPFLSPGRWRGALAQLSQLDDRSVRLIGLASMLLGTLLLYWVR